MKPYYEEAGCTIFHGDSFDLLHDLSGIGAVGFAPSARPRPVVPSGGAR